MTPKQENYRHLGETMIKKFAKRNMEAFYCESKEEALQQVLALMPEGSSVTWGGSMSIGEIGIYEALEKGNYTVIDRKKATTPEEQRDMYAKQVMADYALMSTNAFTADGELVNIDGNANRLSLLLHGPHHVIIVTGMNKFTRNVADAYDRVRNVATPANTTRLGCDTPCAKTGMCADCMDHTICCQVVVTRKSMHDGRIKIVMVGEDLGY